MRPLTLLAFIIVGFGLAAKGPMDKSRPTGPINITAVVDSALIMADNYADALVDKPEMAPTRLNMLRNFGGEKPAYICDTICSRLYDFFVSYTEQNKTDRATAFKDCYLALARPDSPQLGPLYAAELTIARENTDTTAIKKYLPLLEDYATRLDYDYDEELAAARAFLHKVRTRRPINEDLTGVWVSDEMLKYPLMASTYGFSVGKALNVMGGNSYAAAAREISEEDAIMTLNIITFGQLPSGYTLTSCADKKYGFMSLQKNECDYYKLNVDERKINPKSKNRKPNWVCHPIQTVTDNNSRWLYAIWGTEQLKRNNPELTAALRQSIQHTQALVAGQYSRSRYSHGEELLANSLASGFSAISNGIIDHFSVSKDKIYSAEINLQLQHPDKLVGRLDIINVEVRSDMETPTIKERNNEVTYYRWTPEDNVFFLTSFETYVPLFEPSKSESERMKRIVKQAKVYWEMYVKNKWDGKWFYMWFNEIMFSKLQANADSGKFPDSEIRTILEI